MVPILARPLEIGWNPEKAGVSSKARSFGISDRTGAGGRRDSDIAADGMAPLEAMMVLPSSF